MIRSRFEYITKILHIFECARSIAQINHKNTLKTNILRSNTIRENWITDDKIENETKEHLSSEFKVSRMTCKLRAR